MRRACANKSAITMEDKVGFKIIFKKPKTFRGLLVRCVKLHGGFAEEGKKYKPTFLLAE